jgi:hypothetical protein
MLSFRSPLKARQNVTENLRPGSKQTDGAWRGAADWEAKENAGYAGPALLTTRGCAPPDEAPGGGGNNGAAALVRALAAARAEAADLRERLATAAQRGVAVSRERHALSTRVNDLVSERDTLREEVDALRQAVQQPASDRCAPCLDTAGDATAASRKALVAALDAKRAAEAQVRALRDALAASKAEVEDTTSELDALRFQLRLLELKLTSARKAPRPRAMSYGSPAGTPPSGGARRRSSSSPVPTP